jgi:hypothetical protein
MDSTVPLAALGTVSLLAGALIWIIKYLFTSIMPVLNATLEATKANTDATKSADTYLRERNGRDISSWKQNTEFHKTVLKGITDVSMQSKMRADVLAHELSQQTEKISEELRKNNEGLIVELKRVSDLTAERVQQAKEQPNQTVVEQHVEHQTISNSE